jgi:DNA-binding NarL/FixJ family response regulator
MNKPNIIIADDHPAQRLGLKYHLKTLQAAETIFEADNGQSVLNLLSLHPIDIVIMDMKMPSMNGMETTQVIRRLHPNVKIYISSLYEDEALITNLIKLGISGYILKDDPNQEEALAEAAKGHIFFSKRIEPYYIKSLQRDYQHRAVKLTPREEKLLPLIAKGKNSQEIAAELSLSKFTVESYRKELLAKFDLSNSTALVDFAHRIGLL